MSDPDRTVSEVEQTRRYEELVQRVGIALLGVAPQGWRRLDLVAKMSSTVQDYGLVVLMADGTAAEVDPPEDAAKALVELRELMYRPERGTWFSLRFVMNPPTEYHTFYNFHHDPRWDPPASEEMFGRDLRRFPRPPAEVPDWLRRMFRQAPADTASVDPLGIPGQRDLTRLITDVLVQRAPSDWEQIRVGFRAAGGHVELRGQVIGIDGALRDWAPPSEVADLCTRLREGMNRPGHGTWTGMRLFIEFPIRASTTFLVDDPGWQTPPPRAAVLDELRRFPRPPDRIADWMRAAVPDIEQILDATRGFRHARVFDRREPGGRPVVERPPVARDDVPGILHYLNTGHVLLGGRGFDVDVFAPDSVPDVPAAFHTDGTWIWPASIPHYLRKHGVPPEPEFLDHIRANNFTPPIPDPATVGAAYTTLTGEVPTQGAAPRELSERDRRVLGLIALAVSDAGVAPQAYVLDGHAEEAWCLERDGERWQVAEYERGKARNPQHFASLWDAGAYLLGAVTIIASRRRMGQGDRNTAAALNDWPVQPLTGEPPLTLLTEKRMAVLMVDREIIRYGQEGGNLTYAAGTPFPEMSLRPTREQDGLRRYRVTRELQALTGTAVPWHDQPGGGRAYLLPRSVGQHLANGSLIDITETT